MEIFVIGDRDTVLGFRLVGAGGKIVIDPAQVGRELRQALQRKDIRLLLITRDLLANLREEIEDLKMNRPRPIVMDIPGPGAEEEGEAIGEVIRRAIGVGF